MVGVLDFSFDNVKHGNEVAVSHFTIDNGKTWYTLDKIIDVIEQWETPIMFVRHLSFVFKFLQPIIDQNGYIVKYCQDHGNGWHSWPRPLKEKEYEVKSFGTEHHTTLVKFMKFKMYNADKWIYAFRNPLDLLSKEEYSNLIELSYDSELKSTPTNEAWKDIRYKQPTEMDEDLYRNLEGGIQGGVIDLYTEPNKLIPMAYHYDITSMYPYIVYSINKLPYTGNMIELIQDEVADHHKYAYWIWDADGQLRCSTMITIAPAGSYKAPLLIKNPYKKKVLELYQDKDKYTKGSARYQLSKLKVNGFIGRLARRNQQTVFYPYTYSTKGAVLPKFEFKQNRHIAEYTYIIAKAREFIIKHMTSAYEQGAKVLQVNTDGFFTDKPIAHDEERFFGSLREEYVAHNLIFFACNQYVCDEEVCIAGLPKVFYKDGQRDYEWFTIAFNNRTKRYEYMVRKTHLGG